MLIKEWMSHEVVTASEDSSMLKVSKQMKDFGIRRVPIVDENNKVVGIISDRDVKDASPSKANTLDVHELYYLLSELKARDIMTSKVVSVHPFDTIEQVAILMQETGLTGLPVVNDEGSLVGMITEHDIFKVLIEIMGAKRDGIQLALAVSDEAGALQPILKEINEQGGHIASLLTGGINSENAMYDVYIRIHRTDPAIEKNIIDVLSKQGSLRYYVDEKVYKV